MDDAKYIDIAINELKNRIKLLDRYIADTTDSINTKIQERNDLIKTVEVLEKFKENT